MVVAYPRSPSHWPTLNADALVPAYCHPSKRSFEYTCLETDSYVHLVQKIRLLTSAETVSFVILQRGLSFAPGCFIGTWRCVPRQNNVAVRIARLQESGCNSRSLASLMSQWMWRWREVQLRCPTMLMTIMVMVVSFLYCPRRSRGYMREDHAKSCIR